MGNRNRVKKQVSKKTKKTITLSVIGGVILAIALGYFFLIKFYLLDFSNMDYIEFSYVYDGDTSEGVRIDKVYETSDYPSEFRIPNKLLGKTVTEIAPRAFSHCDRLTKVIFPQTIKSIGQEAFLNCTSLASFNTPRDLVSIGLDAFKNTAFINNQDNGDVTIGKVLYTYNGELPEDTAIVVSDEEQESLKSTYKNFINLENYTQIGSGVFADKKNLKYVHYSGNLSTIENNLFKNCTNLDTVIVDSGVKYVGDYAFAGCSSASEIVLPNTIETLGEYSFSGSGLENKVTLPASITSIGNGAFSNCDELVEINIPSEIRSISDSLFEGSDNLERVTFDGENNTNSKISYFGASSFKGTGIKEITIPYSVTVLKDSIFEDCSALESVYLYENTEGTSFVDGEKTLSQGLQKILNYVFKNTTSLKEIVLVDKNGDPISNANEVTLPTRTLVNVGESSGDSDLFYNSGITKINIPKSITWIPATFAKNCSNLVEVNLTNSGVKNYLTKIYTSAFENCTNLRTFNVAPEVLITTFGTGVFKNCSSLESYDLVATKGFEVLTKELFDGCASIESFFVPDTVKSIKEECFANCSNLKTIVITENVINADQNIFAGSNDELKIFLKLEAVPSKYNAKWNCKTLNSEEKYDVYLYSENKPETSGLYWHFVDGVPTVWAD